MKVLIISDSHGRDYNIKRALQETGPIDLLIHLGDLEGNEEFLLQSVTCPVEMVSGNCDYFSKIEREKSIFIGPYTVMLTHGHRYRVNYELDTIREWGRDNYADIVMFGHTHIPCIDKEDDIVLINPGSISQPRQQGNHPSYIVMEVSPSGKYEFQIHYLS